jgi:hypothetical protein
VFLPRHQHDLEHDRYERHGEKTREKRQVSRQRRIGHPGRDWRSRQIQERGAPQRQDGERREHVRQMTPGLVGSSRNEVVQALCHPDLGQAGERSEDEEQLLIRAEFRASEQAGQHNGNEE